MQLLMKEVLDIGEGVKTKEITVGKGQVHE